MHSQKWPSWTYHQPNMNHNHHELYWPSEVALINQYRTETIKIHVSPPWEPWQAMANSQKGIPNNHLPSTTKKCFSPTWEGWWAVVRDLNRIPICPICVWSFGGCSNYHSAQLLWAHEKPYSVMKHTMSFFQPLDSSLPAIVARYDFGGNASS